MPSNLYASGSPDGYSVLVVVAVLARHVSMTPALLPDAINALESQRLPDKGSAVRQSGLAM